MANGDNLFNAPKGSRNTSFHFSNGYGDHDPPEENGDQSTRWSEVPRVLGTAQKITPREAGGVAGYEYPTAERSGRQPGSSINDALDNDTQGTTYAPTGSNPYLP